MKTIITQNPTTEERLQEYTLMSVEEVNQRLQGAEEAWSTWKQMSIEQRGNILKKVAVVLANKKEDYAQLITAEMGKVITSSRAEIDKCISLCNFYAENTSQMLKELEITTEAKRSYVSYEPLGVVLAIMPWNFPFWQVLRAVVPNLMAGNVVVLKHASSVTGCSLALEALFAEVISEPIMQSLVVSSQSIQQVIENPVIKGVTLTGSEAAGSSVAAIAGANLKKVVMELGGSDPFIIDKSADIDDALQTVVTSRLITNGQTCISAKRCIIHKDIYEECESKLKELFKNLVVGEPQNDNTNVGPLSSLQGLELIDRQVQDSIAMGARAVFGALRLGNKGYFYAPTLITNITQDMPVWSEETFGPVLAVAKFSTLDEALEHANHQSYGLAATLFAKDKNVIEYIVPKLQSGAVFVNTMVKSDARLPFGGTKRSGIGRELGEYGLKEFMNIKSVWIEN
jgi:succinate-semialdehyde dehydrogenase / glutarate-semialdehyde dehydrogenase